MSKHTKNQSPERRSFKDWFFGRATTSTSKNTKVLTQEEAKRILVAAVGGIMLIIGVMWVANFSIIARKQLAKDTGPGLISKAGANLGKMVDELDNDSANIEDSLGTLASQISLQAALSEIFASSSPTSPPPDKQNLTLPEGLSTY